MFYLIIISIIYSVQCTAQWHHEVLIYGHSDSKSDRPELFLQQSLHQQVNKRVVLEDGRVVQCNLALDPKIKMQKYEETHSIPKLQTQINTTVAGMVFFQLQNQCAYHRTKEFLWEYCFRKYVRQFDDEQTIKNMQKKQYEEFYIGYSVSYDKLANTSLGVNVPRHAEIPLRNSLQETLGKNELAEVALFDGYVVKLMGLKEKLSFSNRYQISISIFDEDYNNSSTEIQRQIDKYFLKQGNFYLKTMFVHSIVHSQLLILQDKFPFKMLTHLFHIQNLSIRKNDTHSKFKTYLYKDLIYGSYLMAQYYFMKGMQLALVVGSKIEIVQVRNILDTSLIQLDRELEQSEINLYVLDQKQTIYTPLKSRILIQENILYVDDQDDQELIQVNNFIMVLPKNVTYAHQYKINKIFLKGIYVLDKQFTDGLFFEGLALIARQTEEEDNIQTLSNQSEIDIVTFKIVDKSILNTLLNNQWIILQSNSTKQRLIHPEVINNFKLQVPHIKTNTQVFAFQFFLGGLKLSSTYEFHLKINLNTFHDIELIYFSNPSPTLISRQFGTKGDFNTMDARFENKTLLDQLYWVVIDLWSESLYIGQGPIINLAQQLLRHQLKKKIQLQSSIPDSIIVEILPLDSYGIKVNNFESLSRIDYQSKKIPWMLQAPSYTTLNFSTYSMLEQIFRNKEQIEEEKYENEYTFVEAFTHGSFCPPIHQDRSINVTLICDPQTFLSIIKVTEPKICQYKMTVGTKLLCDEKEIVSEQNQQKNQLINTQRIMCVLQQ